MKKTLLGLLILFSAALANATTLNCDQVSCVSVGGGGISNIGARVYNTTNQSIPNSVNTALTLNSESYDTNNIHSTSSNTSRLTARTAGKYSIFGTIKLDANATGTRYIIIYLNGTTKIGENYAEGDSVDLASLSISVIYHLNVDDYVELMVHQNSAGALNNLASPNHSPEFGMTLIQQ